MLADDSPLRRLPGGLDDRLFSFLVGIRYSIESADLAYRLLVEALTDISRSSGSDHRKVRPDSYTQAVMSAWSMVDSVNRLRVLLGRLPNLKKSEPGYQLLRRKLQPFEDLRNPIQHLDTELGRRADAGELTAVWGYLGWIILDEDRKGAALCVLYPGSVRVANGGIEIPNGFDPDADLVSDVQLDAYSTRVNLTAAHVAIGRSCAAFEKSLQASFEGHPTVASDVVVSALVLFGPPPASKEESAAIAEKVMRRVAERRRGNPPPGADSPHAGA